MSEIMKIISPDTWRENRVPPGQKVVKVWPALHYDGIPKIDLNKWKFKAFGLVEKEVEWTWDEFKSMPETEVFCDWHCVTTWSILGMTLNGVSSRDLVSKLKVRPEAKAVMLHCFDKYTTNLLMDDFLQDDVLFTWGAYGADITPEHGWPLRLMVPKLYAWKSAKWVSGVEFIARDRPGFWEQRGYHLRGDPWVEERYS
jgi:DMSO/TMAO reductase YedYZ molybdopterin-dependent catalytic subunit